MHGRNIIKQQEYFSVAIVELFIANLVELELLGIKKPPVIGGLN